MTDFERLQWLDELRIFTLMVRLAPEGSPAQPAVVAEPRAVYKEQSDR
jgi:hypothetical protein